MGLLRKRGEVQPALEDDSPSDSLPPSIPPADTSASRRSALPSGLPADRPERRPIRDREVTNSELADPSESQPDLLTDTAEMAPVGGSPLATPLPPAIPVEHVEEHEDDINTLHYVIRRHWKFFAKRIKWIILIGLLFIGMTVGLIMYGSAELDGSFWAKYALGSVGVGLILFYFFRREHFRWRNTVIEFRGDNLQFLEPDSQLYAFPGGGLVIPVIKIEIVNLKKRTFWEWALFRKARTVTIDAMTEEDHALHDLQDVDNAEEVVEAWATRRSEIMRKGNNSSSRE